MLCNYIHFFYKVITIAMIVLVTFFLIIFYICTLYREKFSLYDDPYLINTNELKENRYLSFLSKAHDAFKLKAPRKGPFRGTCDDKVNVAMQREALKTAFKDTSRDLDEKFPKDPCVAISNHLCEFTDPNLYLSESRFPPRWLMKTMKGQTLPMQTNIPCYNRTYDCCKQSTL
jgi:hypothetical protein